MADQNAGQIIDPKQEIKTAQAADNLGSKPVLNQINREFEEKSVAKRAEAMGLEYIDIAKTPLNPDFLKLLDLKGAQDARLIPFYTIGKDVHLAVENPELPATKSFVDHLKTDGYTVTLHLASAAGLDDALRVYNSTQQYKKMDLIKSVAATSIKTFEKEIAEIKELEKKLELVPAEEGLNLIDIGAMKSGAYDVQYEPESGKTIIRFRIDGMLHKVMELKPEVYAGIANQIKYKSRMKLNVENIPQDGRYDFAFNDRQIDVRVSSIPTPDGQSLVCRYLAQGLQYLKFEELGFQGHALRKIQNATKISHGMVLITGPTGSGKTTTLYSLLNQMKTPQNKIITLEDPVEYKIEGITQSQIDERHGYNFASGLRSVLRHDPNIVLIGEIRDLETAQTAAQAALTGHVLLSTLHTNSAIESIPRLVNMGLERFMVAPSLDTIIAQRLVRKVCPDCVTMRDISSSEKLEFEKMVALLKEINPAVDAATPSKVPEIHGCDKCSQTGYKGRLVVAEAVVITEELKNLILNNESSVKMIMAARKEGMITMREDGLLKVSQGLTTIEEVERVTNVAD